MTQGFKALFKRWNTSVVYKLGIVTMAVLLLVVFAQLMSAFQAKRLTAAQNSILNGSVSLLRTSQESIRLTTRTLSQTTLLNANLTQEELKDLRSAYLRLVTSTDRNFQELRQTALPPELLSQLERDQLAFRKSNEALFRNQSDQRETEAQIDHEINSLINKSKRFRDIVDVAIQGTTSKVLSVSERLDTQPYIAKEAITRFNIYAKEIEHLVSLKSDVNDVINLLQNPPEILDAGDISAISNRYRGRIRSTAQNLVSLSDDNIRLQGAEIVSQIHNQINKSEGYFALLTQLGDLRRTFNLQKQTQFETVNTVDRGIEEIAQVGNQMFTRDITLATNLTRAITVIGLTSGIIVILFIFFLNKFVIKRQISDRFTLLTEDVKAISDGDFRYKIRVTGQDELGDIAHALDLFKKQAEELARSNEELERFAYVAAHDLRSPLNAIQDLATWTLEDERDSLSDECIANLELLIKRSARLSALQSDLLTYARVGEIDTSPRPLNLSSEITQLSDMLDPTDRFKISLVNDPGTIFTHALPVRQTLLNLITNAIKHHDRDTGEIKIHFSQADGKFTFAVEDDGPGIEPRYQQKIFELFKTLKPRDTVEGSGLGLALISKLMARLDGTISVKSHAPQQRGSWFIFELPSPDGTNDTTATA